MLEYIEQARKIALRDHLDEKQQEELYRTLMFSGIELDLQRNNYNDLIDGYAKYFRKKSIRPKTITTEMTFYRARIGSNIWKNVDGQNAMDLLVPFHEEQIKSAPHLMVSGGRFNREGVSYLYLASHLKTCLAEIHLPVGQTCTIAQFHSNQDLKLMNLVKKPKDLEMKIWYEIMTQPVYDEIRYKYLITQFLADVFRKRFATGLYFKSAQSTGVNIVCFQPEMFSLCPYTERIYKASSLKYQFHEVEDAADFLIKQNVSELKQYLLLTNRKKDDVKYMENLLVHRNAEKS